MLKVENSLKGVMDLNSLFEKSMPFFMYIRVTLSLSFDNEFYE